MDSLFNKIDSEGSQSVILGDFNFDQLNQIPLNARLIALFHGVILFILNSHRLLQDQFLELF